VLIAYVVLGLVPSVPKLGRTSPKWPIPCRVGRKTLAQSIDHDERLDSKCDWKCYLPTASRGIGRVQGVSQWRQPARGGC